MEDGLPAQARRALSLLCASDLRDSSVEVLAGRLAAVVSPAEVLALPGRQLADLAESPVIRRPLTHHLRELRLGAVPRSFLFALGLPADNVRAQQVVDELSRWHPYSALLWERVGKAPDSLHEGLVGLEDVATIATLSLEHESVIRRIVGGTPVVRLPAAIPQVFFDSAKLDRRPVEPFAAFVGRTGEAKGARRLVELWRGDVYPRTRLPLRLFLVDSDSAAADGLRTPVSTVHRIRSPADRARVMRDAAAVIFPALHDHLPQAMLETMAAGGLCIASEVPGHRYVQNGVTGLLVNHELSNLVDTLATVLSDQLGSEPVRRDASSTCYKDHSGTAAARVVSRIVGSVAR